VSLPRIVVLASGSGTNLQALIDAERAGALAGSVVLAVADRECGALARAEAAGIPSALVPLADRKDRAGRAAFDGRLAETVAAARPDLVVLAGWMLLLDDGFLDRFPGRVINVHPALLPDDGGPTVVCSAGELPALRGDRAVRAALRQGLSVTGATVHVVTPELDAGPVILREEVPVLLGDDEATLHERIKRVEHRLLPQAVNRMLGGWFGTAAARAAEAQE